MYIYIYVIGAICDFLTSEYWEPGDREISTGYIGIQLKLVVLPGKEG